MFAVAENHSEAKMYFKPMLLKYIIRNNDAALDEVIEIIRLKDDGKYDETSSHMEFTEEWLKEMRINYVFKR
jgi:hypothetical protein